MPSTNPVRFDPSVETIEPDEQETLQSMKDSFQEILETTSEDYGHAVRSVHAKAHGIIRGKLKVHDNLPPELAQGLFARGGEYDAVGRISTNPGDILDDAMMVSGDACLGGGELLAREQRLGLRVEILCACRHRHRRNGQQRRHHQLGHSMRSP